jgi:hypothetical protein
MAGRLHADQPTALSRLIGGRKNHDLRFGSRFASVAVAIERASCPVPFREASRLMVSAAIEAPNAAIVAESRASDSSR